MFKTFFQAQSRVSTRQLMVLAVLGLALNLWATDLLNAAYAASRFPVPYGEAQLSFDHVKIKQWYAFLTAHGTLSQYLYTQRLDFVFIATVLVLHTSALLAVSRAFAAGSRGRRWMVAAGLSSAIAPLADALENAVSFVMLARPADFVPELALAYSALAAIKFAVLTFAYVALPAGLLVALALRWAPQRHGRTSAARV